MYDEGECPINKRISVQEGGGLRKSRLMAINSLFESNLFVIHDYGFSSKFMETQKIVLRPEFLVFLCMRNEDQ